MKHPTQNKYWRLIEDYNIDKVLYLLVDRPNKINQWNDFIWIEKDGYHREYDLPACLCDNYNLFWYKNGMLHRENNKPTYISNGGLKQYFINGNFIKSEKI